MRPSKPRLALVGIAVSLLVAVSLVSVLHQRAVTSTATSGVLVAAPLPANGRSVPPLAEIVQAWHDATPLNVPLAGGGVTSIQVSAVYSAQAVYFRLHWPDALNTLPGAPTVEQQQATVTWRRAETIGGCAVVCHVSFSAGRRINNMQVVAPDVTAAPFTVILDQWQDGWWTLGYSRPLVTPDVEDIQFSDLQRAYPFGLDIAEGAGSAHTHGEALTLRFG